MKDLKKRGVIVLLVCIFIFFLIYLPHFLYPLPMHIDEWFHISQALKIKDSLLSPLLESTPELELGFQIFLTTLSFFINLVTFYKFLPAMWTIFSALVLFFIVKNITKDSFPKDSFFIAIFAMIFFASIKSNVNITGLLFFTPISFSIPFIFLYIYLFTAGIEKQNKKMILGSLAIMVYLLFTHAISVLFAIPILIVYCIFNYKQSLKQYKVLLSFLIIPIIGLLFYKIVSNLPINLLLSHLVNQLQFKYGWGVLELANSPLELYSLIGYVLAMIGFLFILSIKEYRKKYIAYILWPLIVLISIIFYRITGVSYLSPYQRNLYYFAISLPFLSAIGLHYLLSRIKTKKQKKLIKILLIVLVLILTFSFYFSVPENIKLYQLIDDNDYQALKFLSNFPSSNVISPLAISSALYPLSNHQPIAKLHPDTNKEDVKEFFDSKDCETKNQIIEKHNVKYVLSKEEINCSWSLIYEKEDYIYEIE